jgi:bacillithiol biosynthesis cysteine-adding enzyme BshC
MMEFRYIHWKQNQPIAENYVHAFDQVKDLYEYDYHDSSSLSARADWLDKNNNRRAVPEDVIRVLLQYNETINNDPIAIQSIKQLSDSKTLVVVGGQQAGLFTGPLLVIHKAISIIRAARQAAAELGRPVIPVFWIAGEDHDFHEVNHIDQLSSLLTIERIELHEQPEHQGKRPTISQRAVAAAEWEAAIKELEAQLQQTEFKLGLMESLREIAGSSSNLSEMFAKIMAKLFGAYGLVLLDSDDPALRRIESPMFREILTNNTELEHALQSAKSMQESLGFEPSAEVREGSANFFIIQNGERIALHRNADASEFHDKSGSLQYRVEQLLTLTEQSPGSFSNNVFTRPLMQDYLFPVLATVLGPGEISYWGLTKQAFRAFDMQMPIIMPRLEFTLIEGTVRKQLDKLGLSLEDAFFHIDRKRDEWLSAQDSLGLAEQFAEVKQRFDELYAPVLKVVASINPGLKALGETNHQKITEQINFLETRAKDAFESQFDASKRQFERIKWSLAPLGKRQERVYNVFAYLNRYGNTWLDQLLTEDFEENGQHIVVYL